LEEHGVMADTNGTSTGRASPRQYPPELKERATRMVLDSIDRGEQRQGLVTRIARQLDIGPESLRRWVVQAEIDRGRRAGTTSEEAQRITELERENRELRRTNEILKSASAFFAFLPPSSLPGELARFFAVPAAWPVTSPRCAAHRAQSGRSE